MKIFESEFWLGAGANRQMVKRLRLPADSIEIVREGLQEMKMTAVGPDGVTPAPELVVDVPVLVISREVKPTSGELQGEFLL